MTYSLQAHEASVVAFPMDSIDNDDIDDYAANEALQNKIRSDRDEFAYNLDGASDHSNEPPLISAIKHVTGRINELKATQRRLIAFGRHGVTGTPYSYVSLGRAAGRSDVWAKDVADNDTARAEVRDALAELRPAPDEDAEFDAMKALQTMAPARRAGLLMRDDPDAIQHAFPELDGPTSERVLAWARDRFRTTATKESN